MKKFLLGLLAGVLLTAMVGFIAVLVMAKIGSREKVIDKDSTLVLRLEGAITEKPGPDLPFPFLGAQSPPTVTDLWRSLKKAAADPRIKAVVLQPQGLAVGWAKLQEIRGLLVEFKKSKKPLYVLLRAPRTPEYYLATAADKIYMIPEDLLDMKGLRAEISYYKGTFDKVGVTMEAEHAGKYKDALDTYTRTGMSPETREVLNSLLDSLYAHLTETIAAARGKSPADVKKIFDEGPFLADQAVSLGLVDSLLFEDQFYDLVKKDLKQDALKKVGFNDYRNASVDGFEGRNRIALIVGQGQIVRDAPDMGPFSNDDLMAPAPMRKLFEQVAEDKTIKGVILRVDSPGGDAIASDEILRDAKLLSQKKPLVISMSDVAASGGYYISMTGDPIVAYPGTFTGSIGVIYGKPNLKGLYDKLGITKDIVQRGQHAAIDSEYYPLSDSGRRKLREGVDAVYKTFLSLVAESRKKKVEEIEPLAQGRVWLGSQAKDNALIDDLGGLDRALELVKSKAKLGPDDKIRLVLYPPRQSFFEQFLSSNADQVLDADALIDRKLRLATGLPVESLRQGGLLKLMPYQLHIH
jgi:protease IV